MRHPNVYNLDITNPSIASSIRDNEIDCVTCCRKTVALF